MPLAFWSFVLIAVHVSVLVDSKPRPHLDPQSRLIDPAKAQDTVAPRHLKLRASMRTSSKKPDYLVILPLNTHSSNFVSIFDLQRKRFLCMDPMGELYNSRHRDTEDCLFQRLWLDWPNKYDVFYSTSAARLLKLQGVELNIAMQKSLELPASLRHKFLRPFVKRHKRSEEVNPSDPLRTETHPSHPAKNHKETDQPKRDQAGSVSKETISSCDDPLKVLQTNGPGSPVKTNIGDQAEEAKLVLEI